MSEMPDRSRETEASAVSEVSDGTRVSVRVYHSARTQFWQAIEAIRRLLVDVNRADFPSGYIFYAV